MNVSSAPSQNQSRTIELPHTLEEVRAEKARRSLEAYVRGAWSSVEPETPYHDNWHIGAICYHLEAVTSGEIQNLLINIPPGFLKSLTVSVMWPTWEWGPKEMPHLRYIAASNGRELAVRDTLRARRLILSEWYQRHFGHVFTLLGDQNRKTRFDNDHAGSRLSVSVGSGTGERGNRVIFDDPNELDDADYPEQLKRSRDYNNVTLDSRLADRERDSKVVVQQRTARNDVSGDILAKMKEGGKHYEVLCLPMRHDPAYQLSLTGLNKLAWKDPRTEKGELLDPGRYSEASVAQDDVTYGDRAAAILDQNPQESGASMFKRPDFELFDLCDPDVLNLAWRFDIFVDSAYEETSTSDYTAWSVFAMHDDYRARLIEGGMERLEYPELLAKIRELAGFYVGTGKLADVVIERAASGRSAIQSLQSAAEPWLASRIQGFDPGGKGKVPRAKSAALYTRQRCVLMPAPDSGRWVSAHTENIFEFPDVEFDDPVDTFTMGVLWLENLLAYGLRFRGAA